MKKTVRIALIALAGAVTVVGLGVGSFFAWHASALHANVARFAVASPPGIDEAGYVRIGGIPQWITIRGRDRSNPVLLCVHGGPGATWSPLTARFLGWEQHFTVVQWDQRGAGKTFEATPNDRNLTINSMTSDGIEVAEYLRTHLHVKAVVLLGHSWGSILAVNMIHRRPDLFSAYVGTGQVSSFSADVRRDYDDALSKARSANDTRTIHALQDAGAPPWSTEHLMQSFGTLADAATRYGPPSERSLAPILIDGYTNPRYNVADLQARFTAFENQPPALYEEIQRVDLAKVETHFSMPVFFIQGSDDTITPAPLARSYFDRIAAPHKEFISLEGAGHYAVWFHSERFASELTTRVLPYVR